MSTLEIAPPSTMLDVTCNGFTAVVSNLAVQTIDSRYGTFNYIWLMEIADTQTNVSAIASALLKKTSDRLNIHNAVEHAQAEMDFSGEPESGNYYETHTNGHSKEQNNAVPHVRFDAFRAETDSKWTQPKRAISNGNGAYSILCYPYAAEYEPEAFGKYTLLINPANAEPPIEKHLAFLNRRVRIPLHKSWANFVWEESLDKEWLEEIHHYGDYRYWIMKPNEELLEALISTHVKYGMLKTNEE